MPGFQHDQIGPAWRERRYATRKDASLYPRQFKDVGLINQRGERTQQFTSRLMNTLFGLENVAE